MTPRQTENKSALLLQVVNADVLAIGFQQLSAGRVNNKVNPENQVDDKKC